MQAPRTIKDLITGDIPALLNLDLIPWVYDIDDNLMFAGVFYADYFKPITLEELDAIGETPYLEYCDEAKRLKAEYTDNLFTGIATDPYLLTLAKAYRQLATLNKFESLFTGLAIAKPNSKQLKAGLDFGKKYAQHNALLMLANGDPNKLKELETMPVNYIYLTLDYQAEKSAAEARYFEQQKGA